jgi:hypothetical protein
VPADITNTGEFNFTRLSLHHLRLQTLLFDSSVLLLSDGSWKTMAIKWSKFWLALACTEKNDHTTKVNTENNRRRRQQEDIDLEAKLQDNEAATMNFINAAGSQKVAAQVRALWLFWFVASPLLLFAGYMGYAKLQQQRRI